MLGLDLYALRCSSISDGFWTVQRQSLGAGCRPLELDGDRPVRLIASEIFRVRSGKLGLGFIGMGGGRGRRSHWRR